MRAQPSIESTAPGTRMTDPEKPRRRPRYPGQEPAAVPREIQGTPARSLCRRRGEGPRRWQDAGRHAPADHGARDPRGAGARGRGRSRSIARSATAATPASSSPPCSPAAGSSASTPTRSSCPGPRRGCGLGFPPRRSSCGG